MICTEQSLIRQKSTKEKKTLHLAQKAKLFARWITVDGKLVCQWFTSSK